MWRILPMFLDILEFTVENCFENVVSDDENIYNIWRILGTKLVLVVDLWDYIYKTVFPKQLFLHTIYAIFPQVWNHITRTIYFLFSTLNSRMSKNMCIYLVSQIV